MAKEPGFYFYSGDWLKDPLLKGCSKAAKGCWIDMLAILDGCPFRGVFASPAGVPWSDRKIAEALGGDPSENEEHIAELLREGVVSRNNKGAIYSRRMVRDQHKRESDAARKRAERRVSRTKQPECVLQNVRHNVQHLSEREEEREVDKPPSFSIEEKIAGLDIFGIDGEKVKRHVVDNNQEASFAAGFVLHNLDWSGRDARLCYEEIIAKEHEKAGVPHDVIAQSMVDSWREYVPMSQKFSYRYGIANFFKQGIWKDRSRWGDVNGSDEPKLNRRAQEQIGALEQFKRSEARRDS